MSANLLSVFLVKDLQGSTALECALGSNRDDIIDALTPHTVKAIVAEVQAGLKKLSGKSDEIILLFLESRLKSKLAVELTDELYHRFRDWNPVEQSEAEFLLSKQIADSLDTSTGRYLFDAQPITSRLQTLKAEDGGSLFQLWLNLLLLSKLSTPNRRVLEQCLELADCEGLPYPHIVKFAELGNLHDWIAVSKLAWMCDVAGLVQRDLSLCEFLCAFAVQNKTSTYRKFTVHGLNMLQMAVVAGKYLLVRVCIERRLFEVDDIFANDTNALHRAIVLGGHTSHVVLYSLPLVGNNCRSEPESLTTSHYALKSDCKEVAAWARDVADNNKASEVHMLIENERLNSDNTRVFLLEMFLANLLERSDLPLFDKQQWMLRVVRHSILHQKLSVCMWFCDMIVWNARYQLVASDQRAQIVKDLITFAAQHEPNVHSILLTYLRDFLRQLRDEDALSPATLIQSCFRRHRVQRRYKPYLGANYANWLSFCGFWKPFMREIAANASSPRRPVATWAALKEKYSMVPPDCERDFVFIDEITSQAAIQAATP
eukprot:gene35507-43776_t